MFLGSKIAQQRKAKNITQTDLASDICTQNTISKIEKHNVPPTTKILIKLCQRIDLTLNDVFSDFSRPDGDLNSKLQTIEQSLYNYKPENESKLEKAVSKLNPEKLELNDQIQAQFIVAFLKFRQGKFEDAIFECDKVLASTHSDDENVYTTLAYTIKGDSYKKVDKINKAEYYFNIADNFINNLKLDQENDNNSIQIIFVCNQLANYYVLTKQFKKTMKVARKGISLNDRLHTTYFMDSLFKIAYEAGKELNLTTELLEKYQKFANLFSEYNEFESVND
ncbi:helix-turn-helix domain-containing protein [Nicoliella spurrieriana]|uniref:Helix-turn-helix domain-containing protein n=1 Tax=Nicoliella spurrieriana TaxID=2925830 RepID=A0A976RSZ5_9LACO|nr:helix-turn-helix transcriptional regulator [Nicoliella spurrieriana]UQS87233.1 helix-turn-helix domain-containing protein [Nicoliella spurrieriana]